MNDLDSGYRHTTEPPSSVSASRLMFRLAMSQRGLAVQPRYLRFQFRRHRLSHILGGAHLPDLDLGVFLPHVGNALDPLDRLLHRLGLNNPESGDELLRLRDTPV